MDDLTWFLLASWALILVMGYVLRKMPAVVIGSIYGIWIGLQLYTDSPFMTLIFIVLNLYTGFNGIELWDGN